MTEFHCLHDSTDGFNSTFDDISFYEKIGNAFCNISEDGSSKRLNSFDSDTREQGILESFDSVFKKPKLSIQDQNNYFDSETYNIENNGAAQFNTNFPPKEWIENEITGVYTEVSNMEVDEGCTSIKVEKEFNDLEQFNYIKIYTENKTTGVYNEVSNMDVDEGNTSIKDKNEFNLLDKFNYNNICKENEITGVYNEVSDVNVDEGHTSIKDKKEFYDLDQFNNNKIYAENENPNNYNQPEQQNNDQIVEESIWEDEVNTLFSQDVKYQHLDEVLLETSLTDSVDSSTYNFVHSWCAWLDLSNENFDNEEESLLKGIRKDYILEELLQEDSREIHRIALESRQNEVNSIPSGTWVSDHEDDATGRKRDRECDKIALKYNRQWRRPELNKQEDSGPISDSPPIYPAVMNAYTVSGQCHTIDLMKCRPITFQNQAAMRMWDHAIRVNSSKLVQNIEESSFFPFELDRKAELQFLNDIKNVTHEATKLARFFDKTHSDILGLIYREELIILYNYSIVFEKKINRQNERHGITRQFVNIFFNKLSIIRQHIILDTIYQMLVAVLDEQNLNLDIFILLHWLEKDIFDCSEENNIFEVFSSEKEKFESYVENLSFPQIMTITALPERKLNEFGVKASYQKPERTQDYIPNMC